MERIKVNLLDDCFRCEGDVPEQMRVPADNQIKVSKQGAGIIDGGASFEDDLEKEFAELLGE